jgi:hypothetical protein
MREYSKTVYMKWYMKAKSRKKRIAKLKAEVKQLKAEIRFIKYGSIIE